MNATRIIHRLLQREGATLVAKANKAKIEFLRSMSHEIRTSNERFSSYIEWSNRQIQ